MVLKNAFVILVFGILALGISDQALAAPQAAAACVACHGNAGQSNNPLWPNLAGQKEDYIKKALHDFRQDRRQDPLMSPMSKTLTEQDIELLAKYFSKLNPN